MRRRKFLILVIVGMLLTACTASSKEKFDDIEKEIQEGRVHDFQLKIAENIINNYFLFLLNDNYRNLNQLYSEEIKVLNIHKNDTNLKLRGYSIEEMSEIGKSAEFKVRVSYNDIEKPLAMANEYQIRVIKENELYRISQINEIPNKEIFLENNTVRLRDNNAVRSYLIVDDAGIPKYITSDEKGEKYSKIENNLKKYRSLNLNYNGNKICFSKEEEDCYLATLDINEVMLFNKDEKSQSAREEPIGDNIKTLDYLKNANVEYAVFSTDNRFLAVQFTHEGVKRVKIYYASSGEEIPLEIEEKLNLKNINVHFKSFHRDMVNLEVLPLDMKNLKESNLYGIWKLEIDNLKFHKI